MISMKQCWTKQSQDVIPHTKIQAQLSKLMGMLALLLPVNPTSSCITVFLHGEQEPSQLPQLLTSSNCSSCALYDGPFLCLLFHCSHSCADYVTQGTILSILILVVFFFFFFWVIFPVIIFCSIFICPYPKEQETKCANRWEVNKVHS